MPPAVRRAIHEAAGCSDTRARTPTPDAIPTPNQVRRAIHEAADELCADVLL